ncbi:hypothetical protein BH11ARM1_BH11ARM1_07270 [soil metagenome]
MKTNLGRMSVITGMAIAAAMASAQGIGVQVNGRPVTFNGTEPQYMSGRVLVPLRGVFENLGAYVQWDPATRTIKAIKGSTDVELRVGDKWASVDGKNVAMDVPAMIVNGSTLVPIRFVSESLGAQVTWNDSTRTVMIYAENVAMDNPPVRNPNRNDNWDGQDGKPIRYANKRKFILPIGSVLPVVLETPVSSRTSRVGDLVRARIQDFNNGRVRYDNRSFDFPRGTMIEGRITSAVRKNGNRPGMIEMSFGRIVLADGEMTNFNGSLIGLDSKYVVRDRDGMYVAKKTAKDNRTVYAGYGAGAGLLVGLLTKKPLESLAVGGILGFIAGSVDKSHQQTNDVNLERGEKFGIRINTRTVVQLPFNR